MAALFAFLQANYLVILLIISEVLPMIPGVASNSICQLILNGIKQLLSQKPPVA